MARRTAAAAAAAAAALLAVALAALGGSSGVAAADSAATKPRPIRGIQKSRTGERVRRARPERGGRALT